MAQQSTPLFTKLKEFSEQENISFHVPGHKNGSVFPKVANTYFARILQMDLTELTGLDDLHAPRGVIQEAEQLAADYFQADHSFFLIGGSTVGNLAMILATISPGEKIIIQRNCHKSIMHALELAKANPVFIAPAWDQTLNRYTHPSLSVLKKAISCHSDAKAIVLTYPDYFGNTFALKEIIDDAHQHGLAVLIDEAHGVHFSLGNPFPASALQLGADVVVQSAHKMAPAMTMASYLHVHSQIIQKEKIAYYLQMLQSSSPSYPLLASLDLARFFLANLTKQSIEKVLESVTSLRCLLKEVESFSLLPITDQDDPLKLTLMPKHGKSGYDLASLLEAEGLYPELATYNQVLLIHGLDSNQNMADLKKSIKRIDEQLKNKPNHDIIDVSNLFPNQIQTLVYSYEAMNKFQTKEIILDDAVGYVAAEAIIPYPPGIPVIMKGEEIRSTHIQLIKDFLDRGATIQHRHIEKGIDVFIS